MQMIKLTVLALVTISAFCSSHQTSSSSNLAGSNGGKQTQPYTNNPNNPYEMETEIIAAGTFIACVIGFLVIAGVNLFLCMKCYSKRAISKKIKEQMMFKRLEFATNNGLTIQQLNDPRYSNTLHV